VVRQRRLLLLITSLGRGGAERQIVDLTSRFRLRGWAVAVVSMTRPTDHLEELAAAGVDVLSLDMERGRPTPRAFLRYVRFVRKWRPDLVHSHMVHANLLARVGRILNPSVPVVCTVHNVNEGRRWREIAYRLTDRLASATTAVSSTISERYVRVGAVPPGRILTIPNGIDLADEIVDAETRAAARREFGGESGFVWICVGRLVPEKGHAMLVEAFATVREAHPEVRLAIVGDGLERSHVASVVGDRGLGDVVFLLGQRLDVATLLAGADAFVLASHWEGLPMVLLEAAAQALPIVSTDVGGNRDIARADLGAILCEPTASSLAEAMAACLDAGPEERAKIGRALQANVRAAFDIERITDRWEELYGTVQDSGRNRRRRGENDRRSDREMG
jgi:glycosyltransferase involved in cell wall biosynthesis